MGDDIHGKAKYFEGIGKKEKAKRPRKNEEFVIQKQCVTWFGRQYPHAWRLLYMVKNDGHKKFAINEKTGKRYSVAAQQDARAGLAPGVSDLHLAIPNGRYHSLYIEVKTPKGTQSPNQIDFQEAVEHVNHKYVIVRSLDDFMNVINEYLKNVNTTKIPQGRFGENQKDQLFGSH